MRSRKRGWNAGRGNRKRDSVLSNLADARAFYVDVLGLPVLFEDAIVAVVGGTGGPIVLHRKDRGHDERGTFPAGGEAGGVALRLSVSDPDACEAEARRRGINVLWVTQEASWGRFVLIEDPDGRPVALAKVRMLR
jgi:catechol 2,3-dioxygenase-like lactoylglutathione lyase family enzyme